MGWLQRLQTAQPQLPEAQHCCFAPCAAGRLLLPSLPVLPVHLYAEVWRECGVGVWWGSAGQGAGPASVDSPRDPGAPPRVGAAARPRGAFTLQPGPRDPPAEPAAPGRALLPLRAGRRGGGRRRGRGGGGGGAELAREAAHNLALIYSASGAHELAREVLRRHPTE